MGKKVSLLSRQYTKINLEFRERQKIKKVTIWLFFTSIHIKKLQCSENYQFYWTDLSNFNLPSPSCCTIVLSLHECNPAGSHISFPSKHALFCISWGHRHFSGKMFLELTSAVSLYTKYVFQPLLLLVARPHLIPSQFVLLCISGNISLTVLPELKIVFHSLQCDSLFNSLYQILC